MVWHETPLMEDPVSSSPHLDVEREKLEESLNSLDPKELVKLVEISLDEPLAKRRFLYC